MLQLSIGLSAIALGVVGIGMSWFFVKLLEGIARNPESTPQLQKFVFVGFALIETIAIYILVLALLLYGKL